MTNRNRFIMQPRNLAFLNHTAYNINDTMRNILQFAEDNPEHIPINFVDDVVSTLEEVKYYSHLEGDELIFEPIERRYVTLRYFLRDGDLSNVDPSLITRMMSWRMELNLLTVATMIMIWHWILTERRLIVRKRGN